MIVESGALAGQPADQPDIVVGTLFDALEPALAAAKLNAILGSGHYRYYDINERAGLTRIPEIRKASDRNILACSADAARSLGLS